MEERERKLRGNFTTKETAKNGGRRLNQARRGAAR
jgi:hypothetical protein